MSTLDQLIEALQKKVEISADLSDPFKHFMDITVEKEFISESSLIQEDQAILKKILQESVSQYFKQTLNAKNCMMLRLKTHPFFIHGTCLVPKYLVVFFYYENLQVGMAALTEMPSGTGMTHFCRFRATTIKDKSMFHPGNRTKH